MKFLLVYCKALLIPGKSSYIVIQRVKSNFIYARLLKFLVLVRGDRCIYDLDDADYLIYPPDSIHFFARHCRYISAGSEAILEYLKEFNPNIKHITSPVWDMGIRKEKRNEVFHIGWIGEYGWGHRESLKELLFPAIKNLPFQIKLTILGVKDEENLQDLKTEFEGHSGIELSIPMNFYWPDERAMQDIIKTFDLGIATLMDHPIQISKSGIKAKQYMNNGVPVLSNDLPENNRVVKHEFNGLICNSPEDFEKAIIRFKQMSDNEYQKFSSNAVASIPNFNYEKYFAEIEELVKN